MAIKGVFRLEIYVDVLIFINTVVDYLLLSATSCLLKLKVPFSRKLIAAIVSALFSLYIFLPSQSFVIELLMRVLSSAVTVAVCYKIKPPKSFFRALTVFYAVSFIYFGLMAGLWMLFKPNKMSLNNGVVYFNVSPLMLITLSFIFYVIIVLVKKLTQKSDEFAKRCEIVLIYDNKMVKRQAMVDSGHSLNDMFSNSVVLIIDRNTAVALFNESNTDNMLKLEPPDDKQLALRFRMIPVKTVSTEKIMPAVRLQKADIEIGLKSFHLQKPIAVISEGKLSDDYSVIIPPEAINF